MNTMLEQFGLGFVSSLVATLLVLFGYLFFTSFRKGTTMSKEFLDAAEALIAKLTPVVADPEKMKADVLAALQPHLDTIDAELVAAKAAEDAANKDAAGLHTDVDAANAEIADLKTVISDALAKLAAGTPADATAALQAVVPAAADTGTAGAA